MAEETGEDGGFAADEGAVALFAGGGNSGEDFFEDCGVKSGSGEVVQEKSGLSPACDEVVEAHCDGVNACDEVAVGGKEERNLGADAVGARGNEGRFWRSGIKGGKVEESGETADAFAESALWNRRIEDGKDLGKGCLCGVQVYARAAVGK